MLKFLKIFLQNYRFNFNQTWHMKKIQVCSTEGPCPFPGGDNKKNRGKTLTKFKNLLLQNHWANFNQTWHIASLAEGDSRFYK